MTLLHVLTGCLPIDQEGIGNDVSIHNDACYCRGCCVCADRRLRFYLDKSAQRNEDIEPHGFGKSWFVEVG